MRKKAQKSHQKSKSGNESYINKCKNDAEKVDKKVRKASKSQNACLLSVFCSSFSLPFSMYWFTLFGANSLLQVLF